MEILLPILLMVANVFTMDLSFMKGGSSFLWDASTGRSLCYPSEQIMELVHETNGKYRASTRNFNYNESVSNTAHVMCRQLGFSYAESIISKKLVDGDIVVWGTSCLGYEQTLSDCVYQEVAQPRAECQNMWGLYCTSCHKKWRFKSNALYQLSNPKFPNNYLKGVSCEWSIEGGHPFSIKIIFVYFNLYGKDNQGYCSQGFLEITVSGNRFVFCGSQTPPPIYTNGSFVHIRFFSGLETPLVGKGGFDAEVSTFPLYIEETVADSNLEIDSGMLAGIIFATVFLVLIFCLCVILGRCLFQKAKRASRRRRTRLFRPQCSHPLGVNLQTECAELSPIQHTSLPEEPIQMDPDSTNIYENPSPRHDCSYLSLDEVKPQPVTLPHLESTQNMTSTHSKMQTFQIPSIRVIQAECENITSPLSNCCDSDSLGSDSVFEGSCDGKIVNGFKTRNETYKILHS